MADRTSANGSDRLAAPSQGLAPQGHAPQSTALQNAGRRAVDAIGSEQPRHPFRDLLESVHSITPARIGHFAKDELEEVLAHWPTAIATAVGFVAAQVAAGALAGTGVGAPIGVLIEALLLGARVDGGAKTMEAAVTNGHSWFAKASDARGDHAALDEAGDHFILMIVEIVSFVVAARTVQTRVAKAIPMHRPAVVAALGHLGTNSAK